MRDKDDSSRKHFEKLYKINKTPEEQNILNESN